MGTMIAAPRKSYVISADLGQSIDPTAIAIIESTEYFPEQHEGTPLPSPKRIAQDVRHLERLPLRMDYVEQVARVGAILRQPELRDAPKSLVIDMTGVGRAVFDMFRQSRLNPIGVTITAGDQETRDPAMPECWRVAKLLLVSRLQAALHAGDLRVAEELPEAQTLVRELQDFRASISDTGHARFGAREGAHDDLVLAVAIGCWWAERATRNRMTLLTMRM